MKKTLIFTGIALALVALLLFFMLSSDPVDPFVANYEEHCATCHGVELDGVSGMGPSLLKDETNRRQSVAELSKIIAAGSASSGASATAMPAFQDVLAPQDIRGLAIYVAERRVDRLFTDFKVDAPVTIPTGTVTTDTHAFRVEVVTDKLDPLPFSLQPLPDGRILVTEKQYGIRVVEPDGQVSALVEGTPEAYDDSFELILVWGHGWLLDIALHPDYENNGWIYLHHTQRCDSCWIVPRSFNRVVRGRLRDGRWVDEEVIWDPGPDYYSFVPDVGAGGRLAFDDKGYLYISVGIKGSSNFDGVQDLTTPIGKIHRVHDDGRVPWDNPFNGKTVANASSDDENSASASAYPTTWSYGHRSPQGLEYNFRTGTLWSTEMGPRGGDELNLILPGRNYGWPLYSMGLDYDGTEIEYAKWLDIQFDLNDIEQPVVDFTPAPAVSSFLFYEGNQFPHWRGNALVTSLKGSELYRVELDHDNRLVSYEVLLRHLARIRDIETGPDGNIYLLLEHADGGQILRLVPAAMSAPN